MTKLDVLLSDNGARVHTFAHYFKKSARMGKLHVLAGVNPGIAALADEIHPVAFSDIESIARLAKRLKVDFVMVGGEGQLGAGLADACSRLGVRCFGPSAELAQLETSKIEGKKFAEKYGIPTAHWESFDNFEAACEFVLQADFLVVIKEDGLAAGKGALPAFSRDAAINHLRTMEASGYFRRGGRVVIEELLEGEELSVHIIVSGDSCLVLPHSRDHKYRDGDRLGPMTGGVAAFSPVPDVNRRWNRAIRRQVIEPIMRGLKGKGYLGTNYPGLMLTKAGLRELEDNVRFGDPETQVLLPRLKSDFLEMIWAAVNHRLHEYKAKWSSQYAVGIVLCSEGYGELPAKDIPINRPITGLDKLDKGILVFQGGTKMLDDQLVTAGGRVLTVVALGRTLEEAAIKAYANAARTQFEGKIVRPNVGMI